MKSIKKILLLLLVSGSAWAQQPAIKKHNLEDFLLIVKPEDQEKYYSELLKESPIDPAKPTQYYQYRAQMAVDWLAKENFERYYYYKKTDPKFSPVQFLDLTRALEKQADNNRNNAEVAKISGEILDELANGTLKDPIMITQLILEVNAVANARLGNMEIALKNIARSSEIKEGVREMKYFRDSKANYYNRYAVILTAAGKGQQALDTLSKALHEADSNPNTVKTFKEIYAKVKGSDAGADKIIKTLQDEAYQKYYKEVEKTYIADATAPIDCSIEDPGNRKIKVPIFNNKQRVQNVSLPDLNGNTVKLGDYKGKILVVDFWDTGCTPCVSAFAGFERVVNEYKNTPFQLFAVDLFETAATVKTYIAKKGITLDILHDEPNAAYGIKASPTKMIFDPMGNMRFWAIAYAGSTDREYYKLKAMIEITKARAGEGMIQIKKA